MSLYTFYFNQHLGFFSFPPSLPHPTLFERLDYLFPFGISSRRNNSGRSHVKNNPKNRKQIHYALYSRDNVMGMEERKMKS